MVKRTPAACIIGLSINEDLKLKKRKGRDRQQCEKLYIIPRLYEPCIYHNIYYNCRFVSAVIILKDG